MTSPAQRRDLAHRLCEVLADGHRFVPAPGRPNEPLAEALADTVIRAGWRPNRIARLLEGWRAVRGEFWTAFDTGHLPFYERPYEP